MPEARCNVSSVPAEKLHSRQTLKVSVLSPQLGTMCLGCGIDQAVGHGEKVTNGDAGKRDIDIDHPASAHQCLRIGRYFGGELSAEFLGDFINRDDRHNQPL